MDNLKNIKSIVQQFAEAASAAIGLDVEVVDRDFCWVAGTGRVKELIGTRIIKHGIIGSLLLKDRKNIIVKEPGVEDNCRLCPKFGKCRYKKAVYSVIENNNEVIGVIGFSAVTLEQERLIESNSIAMLDFIDKIANLISSKVKEYEMLAKVRTYAELMNTVVDTINKGIMVVDTQGNVIESNSYMEDRLSINKEDIMQKHVNDIFPKLIIDDTMGEISRIVNGERIDIIYNKKPILVSDELRGNVYILEDYKDSKQMVYNISHKQNTISFDQIIGKNKSFQEFKDKVKKVARNDSTVLLIGETGTGKELFARAIHEGSKRKQKPFIAINCGAIPEALIESELFGYEKGAFTGANKMGKHGKFYMADKGTLFLDEVGTMPIYLQIKLLRAIERREIERVGGMNSIPIDVRIIAATNEPLSELVSRRKFREDLYHRLNVITLFIPPLRDRGEDILVLADYFINKYSSRFNKYILGISQEVRDVFLKYNWSGNVRELENTIEYAINMEASNYITKENLPRHIKIDSNDDDLLEKNEIESLESIERRYIKKALDKYGWGEEGRIKAANALGISRATIYRKIKKYEIKSGVPN